MAAPRSLASLSSTLLARKGTARPAMRPQGFGGFGAIPSVVDDLGWNDMGDSGGESGGEPDAAPVPPVLIQREALVEELTAPAPRPVSVATATRIRRETSARHKSDAKSAFTLRLDSDRHLKLRLASALQNRSAQLLVTAALDAFLNTLPEVDLLLEQLPAAKTKGNSK